MTIRPAALKLPLAVILSFVSLSSIAASAQSDPQPSPPTNDAKPLPERVRVSSSVMGGLLLKKVAPVYPPKARKKHIQGTVFLRGVINKTGDVESLSVVSGDPLLAKAAIEAVGQWKYRPYELRGQPVEVETQFQVNFVLN